MGCFTPLHYVQHDTERLFSNIFLNLSDYLYYLLISELLLTGLRLAFHSNKYFVISPKIELSIRNY